MRNFLFLLCVFCFISHLSLAQDLTFDEYGIEEGLPHYYTEAVFEDSKGFLWVGTLGGLVRYDGIQTKLFSMYDGLLSNNIITITEDSIGNIWVGTDNGVSKINNEVQSYKLKGDDVTREILITSKNEMYVANVAGTFFYDSKIDSFIPHSTMGDFYTRTIIEDAQGNIWFGGVDGLYKSRDDSVVEVIIPGDYMNYHNSIVSSFKDCFDNLWFGTGSGFIKWCNGNINVFDQNMGIEHIYTKLFQLRDSSYLFGTYGGGIVTFNNPDSLKRTKLKGGGVTRNTIHGIDQTREGSIWLATGDKLLKSREKVFDKIDFEKINSKDIFPYKISQSNSGEFMIATNRGLVIYNPQKTTTNRVKVSSDPLENSIIAIYYDREENNLYLGSNAGNCFLYKDGRLTPFANDSERVRGQSIFDIYKDSKKNIWISKNVSLMKYYEGLISQIDSLQTMVFQVSEDSHGIIWIATGKGLFYIKDNKLEQLTNANGINLNQIRQVVIDLQGIIWIGSSSSGVFSYDPIQKKVTQYSKLDGLSSDFVQSLNYDKVRNIIWVGTINGVTQIKLNNQSVPIEIGIVKSSTGLPCNVNSIYSDSIYGLIVGSENSIYLYSPEKNKKNKNIPLVHLEEIKIFNNTFDFSSFSNGYNDDYTPKNLILPFNQNHLTFSFTAIEFNYPKSVSFFVKLEGFDEEWVETNRSSITYTNLSPGKYNFNIKARNSDNLWSEINSFSFEIGAPFYKSNWFLISVAVLTISIFLIFNRFRIKSLKQKSEIEINIAKLELKALRSQMNPHFIFNILNNIQNYVITKQVNKAVSLLGDFASLIRNILNISIEKNISLSEEIEFLKQYIDLDLTQYPGKYEVHFILEDNIDTDNLLIPPMLIQPFIENAIIHGLHHLNKKGELSVSFRQTTSCLICIVKDNGVGRKKSKELTISSQSHKSKALNISNDRINQFNKIEKSDLYKIKIEDRINKHGSCIGTKVKIEMPVTFKY